MKVLFFMERFHTDAKIGMTNNFWNLLGSFEVSGYGDYEVHYLDPSEPGCIWSTKEMDQILLTSEFDMAIISVYHILPSEEVLRKVGHKTAMAWWDPIISLDGVKHWSHLCHQLCFDHGFGKEYPEFPNINCVDVPQDTRIFYRDPSVEKEFDVSFVGSIDSARPDRRAVLEKIKPHFNIWMNGGRGHDLLNLKIEEYADIFRKSRICLNLQFGHGRPQKKGRSWECAAMGCLMFANNPGVFTGREGVWFEENVDYVSFNDDNLVEKIRHYLTHEEERNMISDRIYKKYQENYTPKHFWKKIFNICGVQV